jgi:hypothetical protein
MRGFEEKDGKMEFEIITDAAENDIVITIIAVTKMYPMSPLKK